MSFLYSKKTLRILIGSVFLIILDRLLKQMSLSGFFDEPVSVLGQYFSLNFIQNPNIAFSIPLGGPFLNIFLLVLILSLIFGLVYFYKKKEKQCFFLAAAILGASSNLMDRLINGYVIDYFDLKYFTVFNLADVLIVSSLLLFLLKMNSKPENAI